MNIPPFESFDRVWFLTWTTYGTWLPGDERGFVSPKFAEGAYEPRNNIVGDPYDGARPELRRLAQSKLVGDPIKLERDHAILLKDQFEETARYRGWIIVIGAILATHVHLVVGVHGDPDPSELLRDFKSYGSRPLNQRFGKPESGTWWTEQGSKRKVKDQPHYEAVTAYVANQVNPLVIWCAGQGAHAPRSP